MPENVNGAPYKKLLTYRYSYLIFHLNEQFTACYLGAYQFRRTKEQMDQAARSGKQNIVEGAMQGTSLKGYIKLLGVARGSLEELLEDYRDFAVKNKILVWNWREERSRRFARCRVYVTDKPNAPLPPIPQLPHDAELATNIMIDLITRTCYLLDQQRRSLERKFVEEGGYSEALFRRRKEFRGY